VCLFYACISIFIAPFREPSMRTGRQSAEYAVGPLAGIYQFEAMRELFQTFFITVLIFRVHIARSLNPSERASDLLPHDAYGLFVELVTENPDLSHGLILIPGPKLWDVFLPMTGRGHGA
jgi:hypothetical protein